MRYAFNTEYHSHWCLLSWKLSAHPTHVVLPVGIVMARDLDLSGLQTEAINGCTSHIDRVSTREMCAIMNSEDQKVATSVTPCLDDIARAIDLLLPRVRRGGRVIYIGAGTSGR